MGPGARRTATLFAVTLALGCRTPRDGSKSHKPSMAMPSSSGQLSKDAQPAAYSSVLPPASAAPSSSARVIVHSFDAGVNACRTVYGPEQQSFIGEVTLVGTNAGVMVITQRDGIPTVTRVEPGDAEAPAPSTTDAGVPRVSSPPCAVAGGFTFCMDGAGTIHRRPLETEGRDVVVARSRPGASFAAEATEGNHVIVAYLDERQTTEGMVSQAFAVLDEGPPVRLSDEGSGTTNISLGRRGATVVALMLDGRVAMTPVHARTLTTAGTKLLVGEDAVVFVGGGAEANTRSALGISSSGTAYAFVPISGESGFGLASVRLDDPPKTDEPSTWSAYLNGLDPAPIVATRGSSPIRIARVRPLEARPEAPRGLELGRVDDAGAFASYGLVASKGRVKHAAVTTDRTGALWLAFTDGTGTWLERRVCP